ncbi:hypothetical protein NECAME_05385 [Necator americanus]|uniref:Uncharacterized protein n=1 Tax=Necator americanus TaxID=51031 RepID=W2SH10_NECAM|nr:hypothetical protein NECAME_05385 [Necator americanus]ETN68929.1 hypothetical protein NECAME_05385 [Necator americanus]
MIFFFHHYEMPLILYQDRLQRILTEINTAPPAGPLDVQQVTVSIHTRTVAPDTNTAENRSRAGSEESPPQAQEVFFVRLMDFSKYGDWKNFIFFVFLAAYFSFTQDPSSHSAVGGSSTSSDAEAVVTGETSVVMNSVFPPSSTGPVERVAEEVVSEAIDELFLS